LLYKVNFITLRYVRNDYVDVNNKVWYLTNTAF
jgi:hypothetical protein